MRYCGRSEDAAAAPSAPRSSSAACFAVVGQRWTTHQSVEARDAPVDDAVRLLLEPQDLAPLDADPDRERPQDVQRERLSDEREGREVVDQEREILIHQGMRGSDHDAERGTRRSTLR